jgi:glutamyl-tRNA reductase
MTVVAVGISHKQAGISLREMLAVPASQLPERLQALRAIAGVREALLVSTCNRLEIFAAADSWQVAGDILDTLHPSAAPLAVCESGPDALHHLFRVAASLDSMVVGDAQILGQLKQAAAEAEKAGTLGPELRRALARATSSARRVRSETQIARGAVSLSGVAADLAQKLLGDLAGKSVLLLGAGEMGQLAAREFRSRGTADLLVANRSREAAEALAAEVHGTHVSLDELPRLLERVDAVICSTAASHHLITKELVARAATARRCRTLFLVDLSLPRNVEPSANELENVYVYDLDDLQGVAAQNRGLREAEMAAAEQIVADELRAFLAEDQERKAVPAIRRLRAKGEAIAKAEVERTLAALSGLDERGRDRVRAMASAIVNKLLHEPTLHLRAEAGHGPLADAAVQLFGLDEPQEAEQRRPELHLLPMAGNA